VQLLDPAYKIDFRGLLGLFARIVSFLYSAVLTLSDVRYERSLYALSSCLNPEHQRQWIVCEYKTAQQ